MADFYRLEYPDPDDYYMSVAGSIVELPPDYEWMNNDPIGGTRATADGAQSGGHSADGTFFIAFENDATSDIGNRAHQALAVSTDTLDNQLRRAIAVPAYLDDTAGGSPVVSKIIDASEMVWLGPSGTPYNELFQIVDSDGNEIINASGVTCVVTATSPLPGSGGLKPPDGFADSNVQLTIVPGIPAGTTYRIYYGKKGSLAEMPRDSFTKLAIPGRDNLPGGVRKQLKNLHGNSADWDAAWVSTVYELARGGLNERYRRASSPDPAAWAETPEPEYDNALDGDGTGNWIRRQGPALTVFTPDDNYDPYWDPMGASFKSVMKELYYSSQNTAHHTGFVYAGGECVVDEDGNEFAPTVGSFLHYSTVGMLGPSADYNSAYTYLPHGGDCNVGYDGGDNELYISVTAPIRFTDGGNSTDIVTGLDTIEVYAPTYGRRSFLIHRIVSDSVIWVRRLDGTKPGNWGTFAATLRWHPFKFGVSDGAGEFYNWLDFSLIGENHLRGLTLLGPRQHGTLIGPGDGNLFSPIGSYGLNVFVGSENALTTRIFQGGYVTRVVAAGQSTPQVTSYLDAAGKLAVAQLTLMDQQVHGVVDFQDDVVFSDVATFNADVSVDSELTVEATNYLNVDDIRSKSGGSIGVANDISMGFGSNINVLSGNLTMGASSVATVGSIAAASAFGVVLSDNLNVDTGKSIYRVRWKEVTNSADISAGNDTITIDNQSGTYHQINLTAGSNELTINVPTAEIDYGGVYHFMVRIAGGSGNVKIRFLAVAPAEVNIEMRLLDGSPVGALYNLSSATTHDYAYFQAFCARGATFKYFLVRAMASEPALT